MDTIVKEIQAIQEADTEGLLKMAEEINQKPAPNPFQDGVRLSPGIPSRGLIHNLNQRP